MMDLAVSLAELRELPMMIKNLFSKDTLRPDKAFLSYQFGWKPIYNDIMNLLNIQEKLEKKMDWLIRNNGRPVRTQSKIASITSEPITLAGFTNSQMTPLLATNDRVNQPSFRQTRQDSTDIWASARWRYHLPPMPEGMRGRKKMRRALMGLYLSPSVAYNLIPWSWLVDWFSNVGDIIENLDAGVADRCAADYMYLMCQEKCTIERTASLTVVEKDRLVPVVTSTTGEKTLKRRIKGNPFGFSMIDEVNLSAMQLAILGALGSSRL
jgi:hypothetical protein